VCRLPFRLPAEVMRLVPRQCNASPGQLAADRGSGLHRLELRRPPASHITKTATPARSPIDLRQWRPTLDAYKTIVVEHRPIRSKSAGLSCARGRSGQRLPWLARDSPGGTGSGGNRAFFGMNTAMKSILAACLSALVLATSPLALAQQRNRRRSRSRRAATPPPLQ